MAEDEFMVIEDGPEPYSAFFEQDDETGYLYITDGEKVLFDLHIYNRRRGINVVEEDVIVAWNKSGERAAVVIGGKIRGVLGLNGDSYRPPTLSIESEAVLKPEWLIGFERCLADDRRPKTDDQ